MPFQLRSELPDQKNIYFLRITVHSNQLPLAFEMK